MPCSFCKSRQHNIRHCNSQRARDIVSHLHYLANEHVASCNYSSFYNVVSVMNVNQLKIACMHWHNTISPAMYTTLLSTTDTIPEIRCDFIKEKYVFIAMWLYLSDAFYSSVENMLIIDNGFTRVFWFKERIAYLHRIVMRGMSPQQSRVLYLEFIINRRQEFVDDVTRRINADPGSFGIINAGIVNNANPNKYSFIIEQVVDLEDCKECQDKEVDDCPICYETLTSKRVVMGCNHSMCTGCFANYLDSRSKSNAKSICCAICRGDILITKTYSEECTQKLNVFQIGYVCSSTNGKEEINGSGPHPPHIPERFEDGENIVINLV